MRIMAQVGMVMNLDKCIGCHTCSVTCKQTWTNRSGTEYIWFNNVETKPGLGYPRRYEDQQQWKGDERGAHRRTESPAHLRACRGQRDVAQAGALQAMFRHAVQGRIDQLLPPLRPAMASNNLIRVPAGSEQT